MVVAGQHQDDQAETVLLNMLRGAGLRGMSGMQEVSSLPVELSANESGLTRCDNEPEQITDELGLCRPLLTQSKLLIQQYAAAHNLQWVEDPTNEDLSLRRNYLRQQILPNLRQYWPAATKSMAKTARHLHESDRLLAEFADAWLDAQNVQSKLLLPTI